MLDLYARSNIGNMHMRLMRLVYIINENKTFVHDKHVGNTHMRLMRLVKIFNIIITLTRKTILITINILFEKVFEVLKNESFLFDTDNSCRFVR